MAKKKQQKKDAQGAESVQAVSVVAHPRARRSIRRLRAGAGLFGLVLVAFLSLQAGVPEFDALLRGLAGGIASYFLAWIAGVVAWRHLVVAELAAHREAQAAKLRERREAAERRAAEALAAHATDR